MTNPLTLPELSARSRGLLDNGSSVFLLIVALVALAFIAYLVWDWVRGRLAAQRLRRLCRKKSLKEQAAEAE
jgi:Tfp pilus assembly protein PilX